MKDKSEPTANHPNAAIDDENISQSWVYGGFFHDYWYTGVHMKGRFQYAKQGLNTEITGAVFFSLLLRQ